MNTTDWIGFIGVTLLLFAFLLNYCKSSARESYLYLLLNFIGAGLACIASILLEYWPFIILEGCWASVSAFGLVRNFIKKSTSSTQ
ncbi:MAG: hypothetical protein IPK03_14535 [Bacteroidetes bacterium]|nr:hypothetical protein [Bacteroidota bacterium]